MRSALKITAIYVLAASLWIVLSDRMIESFSDSVEALTFYASMKGLVYVLLTSVMLFALINRDMKIRGRIIRELKDTVSVRDDLIRELHHRIKNNLQVVISLMNVRFVPEHDPLKVKDEIINRLLSMLSVFNVVYNYQNLKSISLERVLEEYRAIGQRKMKIGVGHTGVMLNVESAVTLLIVLDAVLDRLVALGVQGNLVLESSAPGILDILYSGQEITIEAFRGTDETFIQLYLESSDGRIDIESGYPSKIRLFYGTHTA